eukprot:CAMPEP_0203830762 /NCGR_PEP_ID=MMETSP0115-20131106/66735_1 /ASSEMBLY_ACC=CAM_ASM_000227 /TAXON_ID=33651 /ORGANISM="Bicosoecid sp, Strain ms1" /LENGTH=251 /DNA_ID=CAMNT_0050739825 /DNA_START=8 /DNA_END=759 /DNA_ORIENTATION=+
MAVRRVRFAADAGGQGGAPTLPPLHAAAYMGDVDAIRRLSEAPAFDVNTCDARGRTAVWYAACGGHRDALRCLAYEVADVDVDVGGADDAGRTPLHAAAAGNHVAAVAYLCSEGVRARLRVATRSRTGATAFYEAAESNALDVVQFLSTVPGVEVDTPNEDGWTPLFAATARGNVEVVRFLVTQAAHRVDVNRGTDDGTTPLHVACLNRQRETMVLLAEDGHANAGKADRRGWAPLHSMAWRGFVDELAYV